MYIYYYYNHICIHVCIWVCVNIYDSITIYPNVKTHARRNRYTCPSCN